MRLAGGKCPTPQASVFLRHHKLLDRLIDLAAGIGAAAFCGVFPIIGNSSRPLLYMRKNAAAPDSARHNIKLIYWFLYNYQ